MLLTEIIAESDLLVPNEVSLSDKLIQLNSINQDFFNVVKIPEFDGFTSVKDQEEYQLGIYVRNKNIDLVFCGVVKYKELSSNTTNPLQNTFIFNDSTKKITLFPAPYQSGLRGIVRHHTMATANFTQAYIGVSPDAPEEYHWTYIPALASFLASTQDDAVKANNYENQYKSAWNVAAQNYAKEVTQ